MTHSTPEDPTGSEHSQPDGQMDLSSYSDVQLRDLIRLLDAERFPRNVERVRAEIVRRAPSVGAAADANLGSKAPAGDSTASIAAVTEYAVRFTERAGWRGWWTAMRRRLPYFSSGTVEPRADQVVLSGWCRSWLGIAVRGEKALKSVHIRNVAASTSRLYFEYKQPWRLTRRISGTCESPEAAAELARALPAVRTEHFAVRWKEMQDFARRLKAGGVRPCVTRGLVVLNIVAFVSFVIATQAWKGFSWQATSTWGANVGILTAGGQWWRLLTALFLHGGLWHLALNMWVLWHAGQLTERLYGSARYALIYFGSGLAASMTSVVWNPLNNSVGASGAIFGVLGAFLAYAIRRRTHLPTRILLSHWLSTGMFALFSLTNGFLEQGVDNAAHIGGLLVGLMLGSLLARPLADDPPSGETVVAAEGSFPALPQLWSGALATLCVAAYLGLGYRQVTSSGTRLTGPSSYLKAHSAMVAAEESNLRRWAEIGGEMSSGSISPAELAREFDADILPFWQQTVARMTAELPKLPAEQQPYAKDVLAYAKERLEWVADVIYQVKVTSGLPIEVMNTHLTQIKLALARIARRRNDADATLAPRALARSPSIMWLRHLFAGETPCVEPPAYTGHRVAATDRPEDGPAQRRSIGCAAQRAFGYHDFAAIENLLNRYPAQDVDPIQGETRHDSVFDGLDDSFEYGQVEMIDTLAGLAEWRHLFPRSLAPDLVEAALYRTWAWSARGHGYAKDISQQQWEAFGFRTAMARAALDDVETRASEDPYWYELRLGISLDQSDKKEDLVALYQSARTHFPQYLPMIRTQLRNLMPRWGGSYEEVNAVINQVAEQAGPRGGEIYTRLYFGYAYLEGDESDLFTSDVMDWNRLQDGFEALMIYYPNSDALINGYAYLACRAEKHELYQTLRRRMEGHVASTAWSNKFSLATCDKSMN